MTGAHPQPTKPGSLAAGWTVEPPPAHETSTRTQTPQAAADKQQVSAGQLVALGLIGGSYALYTLIWVSWAQAAAQPNAALTVGSGSLGAVLQQIVFWCAPGAPPLWLLTVFVLCRGSRPSTRFLWLCIGLIVLLPLPIFGGMST